MDVEKTAECSSKRGCHHPEEGTLHEHVVVYIINIYFFRFNAVSVKVSAWLAGIGILLFYFLK